MANTGMKELRSETSHIRGADQCGRGHDRGPNRQGEISSAGWPRQDKHPAYEEIKDSRDVVFGGSRRRGST
jgi:hypothetical protein